MFPLVETWKSSGQNKTVFCRERQLNIHTFGYWLRKYESDKGQSTEEKESGKFVSLQLTNERETYMEVCYPNGVRVKINGQVSAPYLASLIQLPE